MTVFFSLSTDCPKQPKIDNLYLMICGTISGGQLALNLLFYKYNNSKKSFEKVLVIRNLFKRFKLNSKLNFSGSPFMRW